MATHNEFGKWGEEVAVAYLSEKGYVILERDWHSGKRDIDIIAKDGSVVVFIEVKTRRNRLMMEPEQAVDRHKIRNLALAANNYVQSRQIDNELRFDIITIVGEMGTQPEINHIEDAFLPYY